MEGVGGRGGGVGVSRDNSSGGLAPKYFEQPIVEDRIEVLNVKISVDSLYTPFQVLRSSRSKNKNHTL